MSLPPTTDLPMSPPGATTLRCPQCDVALPGVVESCVACGIRLTGPRAVRLWQVDQQLAALTAERVRLLAELMRPVGTQAPGTSVGAVPPPPPPPGAWAGAGTVAARPRRTGQQLLLGLGALMLLSAAAFFVAVAWFLVGVVGQSLIMAGLTGLAFGGGLLASRRGLAATAETAAVIAIGLLAIDVSAAWSLGLAGVDRLSFAAYSAVAFPIAAAVLVLAHAVSRWAPEPAGPSRGPVSYLPAAAMAWLIAAWGLLGALAPTGLALLGTLAAIVLALALSAAAARRLLPLLPHTALEGPGSGGSRLTVALLAWGAGLLAGATALVALGLAYDLDGARAERYVAAAALMFTGTALAAWTRLPASGALAPTAGARGFVLAAGLGALAVGAGSPALDVPTLALVVIAVLAAVVLAAVGVVGTSVLLERVIGGGVALAAAAVVVLVDTENRTGRDLLRRLADGAVTGTADLLPVTVVALPALALLAASIVLIQRRRSGGWVALVSLSLLTATVVLTGELTTRAEVIVHLAVLLLPAAVAVLAARATSTGAADVADSGVAGAPGAPGDRRSPAVALDLGGVLTALALGLLALLHAEGDARLVASVFATTGVVAVIYAAAPRRLPMAYVGSALLSAASMTLLADAEVGVLEAYSLPLAAMLALIGVVQHVRGAAVGRTPSTQVTMAPALGVALMPSLMGAITTGDELRLAVVTLVAVGLAVGGALTHLRAPTLVGAVGVTLLALTQGGPLIAYVPGWMTLGLGGAVLLTAGVLWEQALQAGRATGRWLGAMR